VVPVGNAGYDWLADSDTGTGTGTGPGTGTGKTVVISEIIGAALLVLGTCFCVLGVYGVLRLPDFYNRLHAAGMLLTLGAGAVLLSVLFLAAPRAGLKALATAGFLALTAPMVTHVLSRTAYRQGLALSRHPVRDDLAEDQQASRGSG
jgi:multicomponent Na+:H+ antiporter subunit G